jgi:hypothetical protein
VEEEVVGGGAAGGSAANENAELVRDRLEKIAELHGPNSSVDDVKWWQKRTRMVIESVVAGNRRFRGALAAFDSLQMGLLSRGRAGGGAEFERDLAHAENLLRNLLKDLEAEGPLAGAERPGEGADIPGENGRESGELPVGGVPATRPGHGAPVVPRDANEALFRLAEAVEKDPGLTSDERHDFRFDVRSLQNEVQKHQPDVKRVLSLIEDLSRFEVDLQAIRRII